MEFTVPIQVTAEATVIKAEDKQEQETKVNG